VPFTLFKELRNYDRRVRALAVGRLINAFGFSIAYPFLSIYLYSERHFSMAVVANVLLAMGAARMAGPLISGLLCDRFGRRHIMVSAPAAQAVLFLLLAYAIYRVASLTELIVFLTLANLMGAFFNSAADTYVADLVEARDRAKAYSFMRVAINIGWMVGPAVGAFLVRTPFSLLFTVTAITAFSLSGIAWVYYTEAMKPPEGECARASLSLGVFKEQPSFLRHCLFCLCVFIVSSQLVSTLSVFTTDFVGITRPQLGFAYTLNGALVILLQFPVIHLFSRVALKWPLAIGGVLYALGYYLLGQSAGYLGVMGAVTVITLGEILVMPSTIAVTTRYAPLGATGRFVGLYGVTWGLGYTIGPWIGGLLYDAMHGNQPLMWTVIASSALLSAIGFATARHKASAEPHREEQ